MFFMVLWSPKNACVIDRSCDATASRITVGVFSLPLFWPYQAAGQFFHSQCVQSRLPSMPGKLLCLLNARSLSKSSNVGLQRYSGSYASIIAPQNLFRDSVAV